MAAFERLEFRQMTPIIRRVAAGIFLAAVVSLTAGQGRSDVREFNVNGFCLAIDAPPGAYELISRDSDMKSAAFPLFKLELGDYTILQPGQKVRWRQVESHRLTVKLTFNKRSNVLSSPSEIVRQIDLRLSQCQSRPYDFGLVEILDSKSPSCMAHYNRREYVSDQIKASDRPVRVLCNDSSVFNCQITTYSDSGWEMSTGIPDIYLAYWPDIQKRMIKVFEDYSSDCK